MDIKKNPIVDLNNYHGLIFSASLTLALGLVNAAFDWKDTSTAHVDIISKNENTFEQILEVPPTEIPVAPPAVIVQPRIVEVPNDDEIKQELKIDFNIEVNEKTVMPDLVYEKIADEPEESVDEIFVVVETTATPQGGLTAFYQYVSENLHYPAPARRMNVEGKVFVEFVVNRDGSLSDIVVVKGIGAGCNEEAMRVIQNSPPWNPGRQRGKAVRQRMVLPIVFKLARN